MKFKQMYKLIPEQESKNFKKIWDRWFSRLYPDGSLMQAVGDVKNDIYLIAETKPEELNVTSIRKGDPLVIGLIENKYAHLIDHFDCTPLENLVKDIYPKEKLN